MDEEQLNNFLTSEGYCHLREIPGHGLCGVLRKIFTVGLCCQLTEHGLGYRYCFHTASEARTAIEKWEGENHPEGNWIKRKGLGEDLSNADYEGG